MIRNTEFTLLTTDSSQDSQERPETRDERAEFDDMYHDKAEEHDREFIGGYGDDLNNTLIFVGFFPSTCGCAHTVCRPVCFLR